MLTIKAMVKKDGLRVDRTYNVKVCFTYKRKVKRLSTSLFVSADDLTKSLSFRDGTPIKRKVDKLVESYKDKCDKLQVDAQNYTLDEIIEMLQADEERQKPVDFIQFSKWWIATATIKGKKNYQSAINAFIAYLGTEHFEVSKITVSVLEGFMNYLQKQSEARATILIKAGKRVPTNRSVSLYLGSIRHLFNEAKKKYNDYDRNIIRIANSPFEFVTVPKQQATRKRAIAPEQIRSIWQFPYERKMDGTLKQESIVNLAKDCFLLSFCLIGMNSADLFNCTEIHDSTITYYRTKTTARRLDKAKMIVKIPPFLMPLFEKYRDKTGQRVFIFHRLYHTDKNFNRAINLGLKTIGNELKLPDLEYYAARHSWATIALNKCKIDKYTIHAALNHVDESMRVTDIYIERDFVNENKANTKVLKYVFGK
jgi:integrase